jgi:type II secretory pathway component PulF
VPTFAYRAVDASGTRITGNAHSATAASLAGALEDRGLTIVDIDAAERPPTHRTRRAPNSRGSVLEATRAISALLGAGVPLARALRTAETVVSADLAACLAEVCTNVERGDSLADALARHARRFSTIYIGVVRAGERSGDLTSALTRITDQLEREQALRAKLLSVAIYPAVLAVAGTISITVLVAFVLPRFADLLGHGGATLPRSTAALLALSQLARSYWPVAILLAGIAIGATVWAVTSDEGRRAIARGTERIPVLRDLRAISLSARFARLLGVLLSGGTSLLAALEGTAASISDPLAREEVQRIRERVREGSSLTDAVEASGIFPVLLAQLVAIGEESGNLQSFLLKAATIFEEKADRLRQRSVALMEPAMIVIFGGIVGFVALSLLQAVYGVNAAAFR